MADIYVVAEADIVSEASLNHGFSCTDKTVLTSSCHSYKPPVHIELAEYYPSNTPSSAIYAVAELQAALLAANAVKTDITGKWDSLLTSYAPYYYCPFGVMSASISNCLGQACYTQFAKTGKLPYSNCSVSDLATFFLERGNPIYVVKKQSIARSTEDSCKSKKPGVLREPAITAQEPNQMLDLCKHFVTSFKEIKYCPTTQLYYTTGNVVATVAVHRRLVDALRYAAEQAAHSVLRHLDGLLLKTQTVFRDIDFPCLYDYRCHKSDAPYFGSANMPRYEVLQANTHIKIFKRYYGVNVADYTHVNNNYLQFEGEMYLPNALAEYVAKTPINVEVLALAQKLFVAPLIYNPETHLLDFSNLTLGLGQRMSPGVENYNIMHKQLTTFFLRSKLNPYFRVSTVTTNLPAELPGHFDFSCQGKRPIIRE